MLFTPIKMTVKLEDGKIAELDFSNEELIVDPSNTLTQQEKAQLAFEAGQFFGCVSKALAQLG